MLILIGIILCIFLAITFLLYLKYKKNVSLKGRNDIFSATDFFECLLGLLAASIVAIIFFILFLVIMIGTSFAIDKSISMYQEENTNIELAVSEVIDKYMKYEQETFVELKPETMIVINTIYPELKSDQLIQQQISLYIDNNQRIKELKEKQIGVSKMKWIVYFGGKND